MNIFKFLKVAKFVYDQIKEENVIKNWNFQIFLFLTTLRVIFWENQADLETCGTWWSPIFLKVWYKFTNYKNRKILNFYQNLTCHSRDMAISISEWPLMKTKISLKESFWAQFTSQIKKLPDICQWNHKIDMHINKNWWSKISCVIVAANHAPPNILNI